MKKLYTLLSLVTLASAAYGQDDEGQSRESMAVDATATQWSFQFAYQDMPEWYTDEVNGQPRRQGLDNYWQVRIVAPIPLEKLTILPRLTLRNYEDLETRKSGWGNTELFALIIPKFSDWGTGRAGIGPLVTLPGDPNVSRDEWGYGFAGAIVDNKGKFFYGILLTQSFRGVDPRTLPVGSSNSNPLGIAPFLNYRIGSQGWYVQTADIVAQYDWKTSKFYLPLGARVGKVWVLDTSSWNVYYEYRTSAIYKQWEGPAVKTSHRVNVTYTIPIGL